MDCAKNILKISVSRPVHIAIWFVKIYLFSSSPMSSNSGDSIGAELQFSQVPLAADAEIQSKENVSNQKSPSPEIGGIKKGST